jgi:hypothetical protein
MDNDSISRIDNVMVAFRIPMILKEKAVDYGRKLDLNLSQVIRRGILMIVNQGPKP